MQVKPLPPPNDAINSDEAVEVLRGWVASGGLQVSLAFEVFGSRTEVWGQLLAETASHLADALSTKNSGDRDAIFSRIKASLLEHLETPDPGLTGTIHSPVQ
jgi:Domain of unknown function (DUF5076)